jgi:hypothetical protein
MDKSLGALEARYNRLRDNGKNVNSQGVLRKIARKIRLLKATQK